MADYKIVEGVRLDKSLIELAEASVAGVGDGRISFEDAQKIWADAMADGKITVVENRTVKYILDTYNCTDKARSFLGEHVYRTIGGVQYDLALLQTADKLVSGTGDGRISYDDAGLIWGLVDADGVVTEVEARTVRYITTNYNCTEKAKSFLEDKLK
jgi:uncharacterized tellurite resistance protein B-like protein